MSEAREEAERRWPKGWDVEEGSWRDGAVNGFILGAEWARAEWEAEQGEVEWEYVVCGYQDQRLYLAPTLEVALEGIAQDRARSETKPKRTIKRRRKAGEWVPVNENGETP